MKSAGLSAGNDLPNSQKVIVRRRRRKLDANDGDVKPRKRRKPGENSPAEGGALGPIKSYGPRQAAVARLVAAHKYECKKYFKLLLEMQQNWEREVEEGLRSAAAPTDPVSLPPNKPPPAGVTTSVVPANFTVSAKHVPPIPKKERGWRVLERESLRKSLLMFGLRRPTAVLHHFQNTCSCVNHLPYEIEDACWDFAQEVKKSADEKDVVYLNGLLDGVKRGGAKSSDVVWDRLDGSAKACARRLVLLDKLSCVMQHISDSKMFEVYKNSLECMSDSSPPTDWWTHDVDLAFVAAVFRYGYGSYDAVRQYPSFVEAYQAALKSALPVSNGNAPCLAETAVPHSGKKEAAGEGDGSGEGEGEDGDFVGDAGAQSRGTDVLQSQPGLPSPWPAGDMLTRRLKRVVNHLFKQQQSSGPKRTRKPMDGNADSTWSQREKTSMLKALMAFGLPCDGGREQVQPDWGLLKQKAHILGKTDASMQRMYEAMLAEADAVLLEAAKAKGKGGEVGEDMEQKGDTPEDGGPEAMGDTEEVRKGNELARGADGKKLLTALTAGRLKERMATTDLLRKCIAALDIDWTTQVTLGANCQQMPSWWTSLHDRDLCRGVLSHGIGAWQAIQHDPRLAFSKIDTQLSGSAAGPSRAASPGGAAAAGGEVKVKGEERLDLDVCEDDGEEGGKEVDAEDRDEEDGDDEVATGAANDGNPGSMPNGRALLRRLKNISFALRRLMKRSQKGRRGGARGGRETEELSAGGTTRGTTAGRGGGRSRQGGRGMHSRRIVVVGDVMYTPPGGSHIGDGTDITPPHQASGSTLHSFHTDDSAGHAAAPFVSVKEEDSVAYGSWEAGGGARGGTPGPADQMGRGASQEPMWPPADPGLSTDIPKAKSEADSGVGKPPLGLSTELIELLQAAKDKGSGKRGGKRQKAEDGQPVKRRRKKGEDATKGAAGQLPGVPGEAPPSADAVVDAIMASIQSKVEIDESMAEAEAGPPRRRGVGRVGGGRGNRRAGLPLLEGMSRSAPAKETGATPGGDGKSDGAHAGPDVDGGGLLIPGSDSHVHIHHNPQRDGPSMETALGLAGRDEPTGAQHWKAKAAEAEAGNGMQLKSEPDETGRAHRTAVGNDRLPKDLLAVLAGHPQAGQFAHHLAQQLRPAGSVNEDTGVAHHSGPATTSRAKQAKLDRPSGAHWSTGHSLDAHAPEQKSAEAPAFSLEDARKPPRHDGAAVELASHHATAGMRSVSGPAADPHAWPLGLRSTLPAARGSMPPHISPSHIPSSAPPLVSGPSADFGDAAATAPPPPPPAERDLHQRAQGVIDQLLTHKARRQASGAILGNPLPLGSAALSGQGGGGSSGLGGSTSMAPGSPQLRKRGRSPSQVDASGSAQPMFSEARAEALQQQQQQQYDQLKEELHKAGGPEVETKQVGSQQVGGGGAGAALGGADAANLHALLQAQQAQHMLQAYSALQAVQGPQALAGGLGQMDTFGLFAQLLSLQNANPLAAMLSGQHMAANPLMQNWMQLQQQGAGPAARGGATSAPPSSELQNREREQKERDVLGSLKRSAVEGGVGVGVGLLGGRTVESGAPPSLARHPSNPGERSFESGAWPVLTGTGGLHGSEGVDVRRLSQQSAPRSTADDRASATRGAYHIPEQMQQVGSGMVDELGAHYLQQLGSARVLYPEGGRRFDGSAAGRGGQVPVQQQQQQQIRLVLKDGGGNTTSQQQDDAQQSRHQ